MDKEFEWMTGSNLSLVVRARIYDIEFENILRDREKLKKTPVSLRDRFISKANNIGNSVVNKLKLLTKTMETKGEALVDFIVKKYDSLEEVDFSFNNKNFAKAMSFAVSFLIISVIVTGKMAYDKTHAAYDVFYAGKKVLSVKTIDDLNKAVRAAEKDLSSYKDMIKRLDKPFKFQESIREFDEINTYDDIYDFVANETKDYGYGYEVLINEEKLCNVNNKEVLDRALNALISNYVAEDFIDTAEIKEDISFVEKKLRPWETKDESYIEDVIINNNDKSEFYQVEAGESLAIISGLTGLAYNDLVDFNPHLAKELTIPAGERVKLTKGPVLTVINTKPVEYEQEVAFETEFVEDPAIYKNKKYVKTEGEKGLKKVKELEYYENGVKVSSSIVEEVTTKEPRKKVVVQGTKELPKYMATGSFIRPTRGRFTSGFGYRWGRMHKGVDIAGSYGTPIKAADSGTVIFVGWYHGLGKMVKVDHGNGLVTAYGHLSSFNVKKGQKVLKGEKLGGMGSTGRSTGVHLHFEVIKNGVHQNPLNYIGK